MNRRDFQRLAVVRLDEARVLLEAEKFEGCYYLSGYVIECALKACIARLTKRHEFPDRTRTLNSYSHNLTQLLNLAGLADACAAEAKRNPEFGANWGIVVEWDEHSRYRLSAEREAAQLFLAVAHRRNGVLRWLRSYW